MGVQVAVLQINMFRESTFCFLLTSVLYYPSLCHMDSIYRSLASKPRSVSLTNS